MDIGFFVFIIVVAVVVVDEFIYYWMNFVLSILNNHFHSV